MSNAAKKKVTFGKMIPAGDYLSDGGEFDVFLDGEHCGHIEKDMIEAYYGEWRVGSYTVYLDDDDPHFRTFEVDGLSDSSPWSRVQRSQYKTSAEAKAAAKAYARMRAVEIQLEQAEAI